MKHPMKSRDVLPKNVLVVGWGGVCHAGVGWGVLCRGGVGHAGVGWGVSCRSEVGHRGVGWVMQGWGGVGHTGVGWVIQGWMIHTEHYHHLHTVPCGNYLDLLGEPIQLQPHT